MSWRDVITVHPAADFFPLMGDAELRELGEDIKANDLHEKIKVIRINNRNPPLMLLDGRNRLDAMELAGLPIFSRGITLNPDIIEIVPDETDPVAYVIGVNIYRRHLTAEQRHDLIAKVLKATPGKSNRQIAEQVKAYHKTVASVRRKLEATGEIPQLKIRTGKDGKARPATGAMIVQEPEPEEGGKADEAPPLSPDAKHDDYQAYLEEADTREPVKLLQRLDVMLRQQHHNWAVVIKAFGPVKFSEMVNTMKVELDQYSQAKADRAATRADKAKAEALN